MSAVLAQQPRFLRRTTLQSNEYNRKFKMLDEDTLAVLTSTEADKVTPLMSKIYLRLQQAPDHCCKRERELHFAGEIRDGKRVTAWDQLCEHLRVSSETAKKALTWMHQQGVIGYSAFKNGIGIFIFLNRAASSIGVRSVNGSIKILDFPPTSAGRRPASTSAAAFNDSFAVREYSDSDFNPHAPKNGGNTQANDKTCSAEMSVRPNGSQSSLMPEERKTLQAEVERAAPVISLDEIVIRLRNDLEPKLKTVAIQAAQREHQRTREWLDKHGIPKATRVAQRETYNVLRSHGMITAAESRRHADLQVGRASETYPPPKAHPLSPREIADIAETCVALFEVQGKPIELTISEISVEETGWLLPEDVPKVREAARRLLNGEKETRLDDDDGSS